ncbi:MAG: hypothetical protein E7633_04080 [Ruminococcaceae bacterium]|nr:hypothetical protein [Oscillospiraceae bacterium]
MAIFTNQATLSYNDVVTNSNVATGELLEVLSATKRAVRNEYGDGNSVTYVVSILNSGTTPITGLTVSDDLGAYTFNGETLYPLSYREDSLLYYVNGVLQADPTVTAGPPLTVSGISVPGGGNAVIVYEATVNQFAPLGVDGSIVNTATVSGGGITTPVTASETVTALSGANLMINKSIYPTTVSENSRVTYTFTIQNYGNTEAVATDNATLTDIFDPALSDLVVVFNGNTWSEGTNYTYDEATGSFVTVPGQITVPAASYVQDAESGVWTTVPGVSVLTVTGTI